MWHNFVRKYDNCTGVELFENASFREVGDIMPLVVIEDGGIYSYTDYSSDWHPVWRCVYRNLNTLSYIQVTTDIDGAWDIISLMNGKVLIRGALIILVHYDNSKPKVRAYITNSKFLGRIIPEEIKNLRYLEQVYEEMNYYEYQEIMFA